MTLNKTSQSPIAQIPKIWEKKKQSNFTPKKHPQLSKTRALRRRPSRTGQTPNGSKTKDARLTHVSAELSSDSSDEKRKTNEKRIYGLE